ncbi:MAG: hypothetical protein ACI8RP_001088 [Urechidicola sp.]|jgi:hypothetical protein
MDAYVTKPFDEDIFSQTILKVSHQKTNDSSDHNLEVNAISSDKKLYDLLRLRDAS